MNGSYGYPGAPQQPDFQANYAPAPNYQQQYAPQGQPNYQQAPAGQWQNGQQGQENEQVQDIICRAATKNKFLDFRNNLVPAFPKDYAMMHGIGGAKYARKSTIKLYLTDYGVKPTVCVSSNISPELPYELLDVCLKNRVTPTVDVAAISSTIARMRSESQLPPSNGETYYAIPASALDYLGGLVKGTGDKPSAGVDYSYKQERVNVYAEQGGIAPVTSLVIERQGLRNGSKSMMPWYIKISSFKAKVNVQRNGTTSYVGGSAFDVKDAFINLSDADMLKCMVRITHFIDIWEQMECSPIISEGMKMSEDVKNNRRNAYNGNDNNQY